MQTVKKLSNQRSDKGSRIYRSETKGLDSRKAKSLLKKRKRKSLPEQKFRKAFWFGFCRAMEESKREILCWKIAYLPPGNWCLSGKCPPLWGGWPSDSEVGWGRKHLSFLPALRRKRTACTPHPSRLRRATFPKGEGFISPINWNLKTSASYREVTLDCYPRYSHELSAATRR